MEIESPSHRTRDWIAVLFALALPTLVTFAYFVFAARFAPAVQQTTYAIAKTFQFIFPVLYVVFIQRQTPRIKPVSSCGVGLGLAFGLVVSLAMLALYGLFLRSAELFTIAAGEIRAKIAGMDLDSAVVFIAVGVFYSLIHSFLEEYYWRWFVFGQLTRLTRLGPAILISSLGFMAHHILVIGTYFGYFTVVTWIFSLCVAIGGAFWAWLYHRSGSLLGPWISHLLVDAAIFALGFEIARPLLSE